MPGMDTSVCLKKEGEWILHLLRMFMVPLVAVEVRYEGMQMQMDVNTFGPLKITQAFLPHMRKRREGTLVYVSSRSSFRARNPLISFYAASKAALDGNSSAALYSPRLIRTFAS